MATFRIVTGREQQLSSISNGEGGVEGRQTDMCSVWLEISPLRR